MKHLAWALLRVRPQYPGREFGRLGGMRAAAVLLSCAVAGTASAADIRLLSVSAVEPALVKLAEQFRRDNGHRVRIQFGTTQQMERRLAQSESPDLLLAPPGLMNDQLRRGKVEPEGHYVIGRVGVGVAMRAAAAPEPDIATLERFKVSLLAADTIVYSQASPGLYLEKLLDLLGVGERLKPKTVRYAGDAQVLEYLTVGRGGEIGFATITEIRAFEPKGVKLVGPLPAQIQSTVLYSIGVLNDAPTIDVAREFVRYLGTSEARAVFIAAGIE